MVPLKPELTLHIGPGNTPRKVAPKLLEALREADVVCSLDEPSRCRLVFKVPRFDPKAPAKNSDYFFLMDGELAPLHRIEISAGLTQQAAVPLFKGFVTAQGIEIQDGENRLIIEGQDLSLKMDLFQLSLEYPNKAPSAIVKEVLGKYQSLGLTPKVIKAKGEKAPASFVPQQCGTDRAFLRSLADAYGYDFYIAAHQGSWQAYWGPPVFTGKAQHALSVNFGRKTNVRQLSVREDGLMATQTYGSVLDPSKKTAKAVPIAIKHATWRSKLTKEASISSALPRDPANNRGEIASRDVRGTLLRCGGLDPQEAERRAQGLTNRSVLYQQRVEGYLDTKIYRHILALPGLVDLRGIGKRFDGRYMVRQVTHRFVWSMPHFGYTQDFVLARDGRNSNISEVAQP